MSLTRTASPERLIKFNRMIELGKQLETLQSKVAVLPENSPQAENARRHIESTRRCIEETRQDLLGSKTRRN